MIKLNLENTKIDEKEIMNIFEYLNQFIIFM